VTSDRAASRTAAAALLGRPRRMVLAEGLDGASQARAIAGHAAALAR
jgi:hypothetical protein